MEEVLKALQGKSMTKNDIFDFLAELVNEKVFCKQTRATYDS